jgi:cob(I)alamin adenosyltransferase
MSKSSVYTRGGDKGQTSLVSGNRISKGSDRINLYGEVDELNSHLGLIVSELYKETDLTDNIEYIEEIQSRLFDLGSNLACEKVNADKYKLPQLTEDSILTMEAKIDSMDSVIKPLKNFILPGGHTASAQLHIARTICRRIERNLVRFSEENTDEIPVNSIQFINRLSDFLFVMARYVNHKMKKSEILWKVQ